MDIINIEVRNLSFSWGNTFSIEDISFEVKTGECFQVMGDSNAGKSTLFKLCLGLLKPQEGIVLLFSQDIAKLSYQKLKEVKKRVGVVFQEATPINNISVFENVALPLRYHTRLTEKEIRERVDAILDSIGIIQCKDLRPHKLVHREKIKLDIARALVLNPEILFLDAVFLPLSLEDRVNFLNILKRMKNDGLTIFITGNTKMLLTSLADKVMVLRCGKTVALSTSEKILLSDNPYIKSLILGEVLTQKEENNAISDKIL